ncbi:MAG: winged helix-turn-helix domain-containing protein [Planctomycetes bacterium]|nr:winged helix-turn-helix domain-containing protein [Planctomycetota bacterium]
MCEPLSLRAGEVVSRTEIAEQVYDSTDEPSGNAIGV